MSSSSDSSSSSARSDSMVQGVDELKFAQESSSKASAAMAVSPLWSLGFHRPSPHGPQHPRANLGK